MIAAIIIFPVFLYNNDEIEIDKRKIGTPKYNNWIKKKLPNKKHIKRTITTKYKICIPKIVKDVFKSLFSSFLNWFWKIS